MTSNQPRWLDEFLWTFSVLLTLNFEQLFELIQLLFMNLNNLNLKTPFNCTELISPQQRAYSVGVTIVRGITSIDWNKLNFLWKPRKQADVNFKNSIVISEKVNNKNSSFINLFYLIRTWNSSQLTSFASFPAPFFPAPFFPPVDTIGMGIRLRSG